MEKEAGFKGLHVARLKLLFSFVYREIRYDCALIHWFERTAEVEDELTGMWTVEPENDEDDAPHFSVVHIDTILRAAHLIPVYDGTVIDKYHRHETTLDNFNKFFVNNSPTTTQMKLPFDEIIDEVCDVWSPPFPSSLQKPPICSTVLEANHHLFPFYTVIPKFDVACYA